MQNNGQPSSAQIISKHENREFRIKRNFQFWVSFIVLIALGVLVYWLYQQFLPRIEEFGPAIIWINGKVFLILLPIALILLLWLFFSSFPVKKQSVKISSEGFYLQHGKKEKFYEWEDLESITLDYSQGSFLGIKGQVHKNLILRMHNGTIIKLDERFDEFEGLVREMREQAFPYLYGRAKISLNKTGTADFGVIKLLNEGILEFESKAIPLKEITSVKLENGWLKWTHKNNLRYKQRVERIENLDVLIKLIEEQASLSTLSNKSKL